MSSKNKISLVLLLVAVSFVLTASGHRRNCTAVNSTHVMCAMWNGTMGGGGGRHREHGRGMISGLLNLVEAENRPTNDLSPQLTDDANMNNPEPYL